MDIVDILDEACEKAMNKAGAAIADIRAMRAELDQAADAGDLKRVRELKPAIIAKAEEIRAMRPEVERTAHAFIKAAHAAAMKKRDEARALIDGMGAK